MLGGGHSTVGPLGGGGIVQEIEGDLILLRNRSKLNWDIIFGLYKTLLNGL